MSLGFIFISISGPAWGADPNSVVSSVANDPVGAMGYVVGQIIRCDQGAYSTEKSPTLSQSCVTMQSTSAQLMIQAVIGKYGSDAVSTLKTLKTCPSIRDDYYKNCVAERVAKAEAEVQKEGSLFLRSSAIDVACKTNKLVGETVQLRQNNADLAYKLDQVAQIERKLSESDRSVVLPSDVNTNKSGIIQRNQGNPGN